MYDSVAELLAEEPVLAKRDPSSGPVDPEVDSEVAAFHREILRDGPMGSCSDSCLKLSGDLPKKYLNPGRPADLWHLYESAPGCLQKGTYSTFKRVWRENFAAVLGFRAFGTHACCTDCSLHRASIRSAANAQERHDAADAYRSHLRAQWRDRQLYWKVRQKSRERDGDMLTVIVDGADQAKFRVFKFLGPAESTSLSLMSLSQSGQCGGVSHVLCAMSV